LRWMAVALFALSGALAANAILGPLLLDVVDYPFSETVRNQAIGLEAVTLLLVVPWAVFAGGLALRGHALAPVLAIPPGGYAAYMMVQYIVGPNYVEHAGVIPLHLAIFILGVVISVAGWALQPNAAFRGSLNPRYALLPAGLGLFVLARYIPLFAGAFSSEPLAEEYVADPAMYWTIVLLDVGLVIPACVAVALAVLYRSGPAAKALYALLGWFVLVPISVAAMAIVMLANDDPNESVPTVALLSVAATLFTAFALWMHGKLAHVATM